MDRKELALVEAAYEEIRLVLRAQRRDNKKGAWTVDRAREAKKEARRVLADYQVASLELKAKNPPSHLRNEVAIMDSKVRSQAALFNQYVNEKRLEYAKARQRMAARRLMKMVLIFNGRCKGPAEDVMNMEHQKI